MDTAAFHFLAQNNPNWVSRFATTALPTDLTDRQLRELGFRSYREVRFLVRCPDYPDCSLLETIFRSLVACTWTVCRYIGILQWQKLPWTDDCHVTDL